MKTPSAGPVAAILTPDAEGWRVIIAGNEDRVVSTLEEGVGLVPSNASLDLALPGSLAFVDSHQFPSTDREELGDMLQLQLEKELIYPIEEVSYGFEIVEQEENETRLISVSVSHGSLEQLCAPLRSKHRLPERITVQALRVPALCKSEGVVLAIWPELGQITVALIENGKLAWLHQTENTDVESLQMELPGALLAAELAGVKVEFSVIYVSPACEQLLQPLSGHFEKPAELMSPDVPEIRSHIDLLPASWRYEASRRERGAKLKQQLIVAVIIYMLIQLGSFVYIAWLKREVRRAENQLVAMGPMFEQIATEEHRWDKLAPAIEPKFFTAEILHRLATHCNPEAVQFTSFVSKPGEWVLSAEARNSDEGYAFKERLKKDPEMEIWQLPLTTQYEPMKDGRVSFTISGKLP